jgi:uridine monophosphate synthetase
LIKTGGNCGNIEKYVFLTLNSKSYFFNKDTMKGVIINDLFKYGIIKNGEFTLKSGETSNVYVDFRKLISFPNLFNTVVDVFVNELVFNYGPMPEYEYVCGVSYGAIPLATMVAFKLNKPLIYYRKDKKEHGTGNIVEGSFEKGGRVLLIDDVYTTGSSVNEAIKILNSEKLHVVKCAFLLDRSPNRFGSSLFRLDDFIKPPQIQKRTFYSGVAQKIWDIVVSKKSNVIVALDMPYFNEMYELASKLGPKICGIKIHSDITMDLTVANLISLRKLADDMNFIIIEDRKFADIGNVVVKQCDAILAPQHADLITVHGIFGIKPVRAILSTHNIGVLLIAEVSGNGNIIDQTYTENVTEIAEQLRYEGTPIVGFICQSRLLNDDGYLCFTPGVNNNVDSDTNGQKYRNSKDINTDIVIVGRGITNSPDPLAAVDSYNRSTI